MGIVAVAWAALGGGASCLPVDTRPPAGTVLLALAPGEQAPFTTVDGWSIAVDRLLLGVGDAALSFGRDCFRYSDSRYMRLLDARLSTEQKVNQIFGFGTCYLDFRVQPPDPDTLLGEGVSEMDKASMQGDQGRTGQPSSGIAVDFAATATRGAETKRLGNVTSHPHSLEDYMYLVLLLQLLGFHEEIACSGPFHFGSPPADRPEIDP
jgi:hypothetical protein